MIVGAFSCASAEAVHYILPAVPMLAILIADGLIACAWHERSDSARRALRAPDSRILAESGPMLGILGACVIAAAVLAPIFRTPYPIYVQPALYAIGAILVAGGAVTGAAFFTRRNAAGLGAIVITTALALVAGNLGANRGRAAAAYALLGERSPRARPARNQFATIATSSHWCSPGGA